MDRLSRRARPLTLLVAALAAALGLLVAAAPTASAHVVPTSTVQLEVHEDEITAEVAIPVSDVAAATGLDLGDGSATSASTAVTANTVAITAYLAAHFTPTTDDGQAWSRSIGALTVVSTGNPTTTGLYAELETTVTLVPPAGADARSFNLGYDAVVEKVATHVVIVTVAADWATGSVGDAREVGVVRRDTVTNTVSPLHVDLGTGSTLRGFLSMLTLGMQHIREGTDHQLFLLTLLLPAPLLVPEHGRRRRWRGPVPVRRAVRRIASVTLAFTVGHSVTLALGTLGVPVPQHLIEALIAVSILVAAVHAIRPLFPGREALVAGTFGLVHGLAFSEVLRALDLTGSRLALSLLGFNVGIEIMQLLVVALVLPPLILLAKAQRYHRLRLVAATFTAVAALGWLAARLGLANPVAELADRLGVVALPAVLGLWVAAAVLAARHRRQPRANRSGRPAGPRPADDAVESVQPSGKQPTETWA